MPTRKMEVCIALLLALCATGCRESEASRANRERYAQREAEMEGTAPNSSAAPSFVPVASQKATLEAGKVQQLTQSFRGPLRMRLMVHASQQVSFALVPKDRVNDYRFANDVGAAMDKMPCGSGGTGSLTISCELTEADTGMVLLVADMRSGSGSSSSADSTEAMKNRFNTVSVDFFSAPIPQ